MLRDEVRQRPVREIPHGEQLLSRALRIIPCHQSSVTTQRHMYRSKAEEIVQVQAKPEPSIALYK